MNAAALPLSLLDWLGFSGWAVSWIAYQAVADRATTRRPNLAAAIRPFRRAWMREAFERDNRVTDAALLGNLMQSATFLASTTLLVIGGLLALMGGIDESARIVQSLPFAQKTSLLLFELKALVLTLVLVYAFLRFLWSIRQFNLVVILLGAYPPASTGRTDHAAPIEQAARLNELAGSNFTQGLRAYYYAVPVLLWLVNPWLLMAGSAVITVVTYYMEFRSASVAALTEL